MTYTTFEEDSFEPTMPIVGVQSEELVEPQTAVTPDANAPTEGAEVVPPEPQQEQPQQGFDPTAPGSGAGFIYGSGDPNESLLEGLGHYGGDIKDMAPSFKNSVDNNGFDEDENTFSIIFFWLDSRKY